MPLFFVYERLVVRDDMEAGPSLRYLLRTPSATAHVAPHTIEYFLFLQNVVDRNRRCVDIE